MKKKANRNTCTSSKFFLVRTYDILDIIRPIVVAVNVLFCFVLFVCLFACFFVFFCCFQCRRRLATLFPGLFLLLRERTLVTAGHMAPIIWEPKIREGKRSK